MRKTFALTVLGCVGILFGIAQAVAQTPSPAAPAAFAQEGERTCLKCHNETKVIPILRTPHAVKGDPHAPFGQNGCEACHGPGGDHAALKAKSPSVVFKGPNISPVETRNQACLSCHQSGLRMNWRGSQHQSSDIGCTNCHTIHVQKDPVLVKSTQPEICFTCHATQRAQSFRFSHHPIREVKVVCSDCHNPHGSAGPTLLKEVTVNQTCYNCHAEKRGPLVREHPPVRENCLICHTPHGSTQARLLIERPPYLCQNCHDGAFHPGQPYSGQNLQGMTGAGAITTRFQMIGRACLNCHSQVHG